MEPLKKLLIEYVRKEVLNYFNITMDEIDKAKNPGKKLLKIYPRQVLEYCLHSMLNISDAEVADMTGVNRATVLNSCSVIERDLKMHCYIGPRNFSLKEIKPLIENIKTRIKIIKDEHNKSQKDFDIKEHLERIGNLKNEINKTFSMLETEISEFEKEIVKIYTV